jgi:predicted amidophosphoribosyltransferase
VVVATAGARCDRGVHPLVSRLAAPAATSASLARLGSATGALLDLMAPGECAGCRRPGAGWCRRCELALGRLRRAGPRVDPDELSAGAAPPTWAWGAYGEPLRTVVTVWKDEGRRDVEPVLAPLLAASLTAAVAGAGWSGRAVLVVPAPSSRSAVRRRGDAPLLSLAGRAVACVDRAPPGASLRVAPALQQVRQVADQAGLGSDQRAANLVGAAAVRHGWRAVVAGRPVVLVDDVVTTGSTLTEGARALHEAGAADVVGAVVAVTRRRHPRAVTRR